MSPILCNTTTGTAKNSTFEYQIGILMNHGIKGMTQIIRLLLLLLPIAAAHAQARPAAATHPIEKAYDKCLAKIPKGQNFNAVRSCQAEALRQWDKELARLVAADTRPTAKAEQANWEKRRDAALLMVKRSFAARPNSLTAQDELRYKQIEFSRSRALELAAKVH
jgi:predicted secreted protein